MVSSQPSTGSSASPRVDRRRPGRIGWWYAGLILDLVHMPLVIGMVLFGATIWHGEVYAWVVSVVVILQVATLGCPVMWITRWMKRLYDPDYEAEWSFTAWLYHRYGRVVGIVVFLFFLGLATMIRVLFF